MALPDSYTIKIGAIPEYFNAMKNAEPPDRFSYKFLQDLDFSSSNDRLFVGILKELGFLSQDGVPTERYYQFLDREHSERIIAEGIREAYADLFAINKDAHKLTVDEAQNKLRTLYKGAKKDSVIKNIAKTFVALCEVGDFNKGKTPPKSKEGEQKDKTKEEKPKDGSTEEKAFGSGPRKLDLGSLQYHINIALPETRDQAVYDAIFKSLRDHLG